MGDLTRVTIDFETSHLLFPKIIACILIVLGIAILIRERKKVARSGAHWANVFARLDKIRFFGTLALTVAYFSLMVPVGDIWPNTGLGFLICSIPFVLLTGLLFMHERSVGAAIPIVVTAIAVPTLVWWLFTDLFFLTLP